MKLLTVLILFTFCHSIAFAEAPAAERLEKAEKSIKEIFDSEVIFNEQMAEEFVLLEEMKKQKGASEKQVKFLSAIQKNIRRLEPGSVQLVGQLLKEDLVQEIDMKKSDKMYGKEVREASKVLEIKKEMDEDDKWRLAKVVRYLMFQRLLDKDHFYRGWVLADYYQNVSSEFKENLRKNMKQVCKKKENKEKLLYFCSQDNPDESQLTILAPQRGARVELLTRDFVRNLKIMSDAEVDEFIKPLKKVNSSINNKMKKRNERKTKEAKKQEEKRLEEEKKKVAYRLKQFLKRPFVKSDEICEKPVEEIPATISAPPAIETKKFAKKNSLQQLEECQVDVNSEFLDVLNKCKGRAPKPSDIKKK